MSDQLAQDGPQIVDHGRNRFARSGQWGRTGKQGRGPSGAPLCRCGCGAECRQRKQRKDGKPGAFFTTATATCHDKWCRVFDPNTVRRLVAARDKGVCAKCGVVDPRWEADHIVPVVEGGGCCDLDGMRTLCLSHHKAESAALAKRLAAKRADLRGRTQLNLEIA